MKKLNRVLTMILSFILVFSCIPITAHAYDDYDDIVKEKWKLQEVIWPDSPSKTGDVTYHFTYTRTVQDLIDSAKTTNDSCWHAFMWLEDVYYFNETTKTAYYNEIDALVEACKGYISIDENNARKQIIEKLKLAKQEVESYNYDLETFKYATFDPDTIYDLAVSGQIIKDGSSDAAFEWVNKVDNYFSSKSGFAFNDIKEIAKNAKTNDSIDKYNHRNRLIGYMYSLLSVPNQEDLTHSIYEMVVNKTDLYIVTQPTSYIEEEEYVKAMSSIKFAGTVYNRTKYYGNHPFEFKEYKVDDCIWNGGSYNSYPISATFKLKDINDTSAPIESKDADSIDKTTLLDGSVNYRAKINLYGIDYYADLKFPQPIDTEEDKTYTILKAEWDGSYETAPTKCTMTIQIECGSDISTTQQTTTNVNLVSSNDTQKVYEATLLYETCTLTARITYNKSSIHSGTLTATDFTWDLYKDGSIKQMWDKAITLVNHTCQDSNDVAEPISGPGIGTETDSLGEHTIVWKCKYLTCEQKVTLVNTKPETPTTKEYKVVDCKWEGGSFYEAPTKATFTLQNTKDSSDTVIKDTTNISASAQSENHIQYEAILLYNNTYYSSFIEFDKPENNKATLTAEPFEWDVYVDGIYTSPAFFKKAQSKVTYITSNFDGNSSAWPKSGMGIDVSPDGPGEYSIVWTCTEGLEAVQKVTLLDSTPPEVPRPEPVIESPFDPEPSIDETTTEVNLVKGQKFTKYGWSLINGSDKQYLSISKKGVFIAKKNTSKSVLITNGTQTVSVNIATPEYSKKETMNAGQIKVMPFSIDNTKYNVSWSSSNVDVATINKSGLITAIGKGTATITAHVNGKKYNCKITVKEPTTAINRTLHINVGSSKTFKVKGIKKWTASDNIVAVNKNKITALSAGTTTITAEKDGITYKTTVIVEDPSIKNEDITISKKKYNLMIAEGHTLPIIFSDIDRIVTFNSTKPNVAYVNENGELVAKNAGKTKLTTKINGKAITINVTVANSFEVIDFD